MHGNSLEDVKNNMEVNKLLENEELYNYLKQLDNVDFLKLLKQEMEKYKLNFTSTINNFYEESFSESHKLLQKIMI